MRIFQDINLIFEKHQKAKKTYIQRGGAFNLKKSKILLIKKDIKKHIIFNNNENVDIIKKNKIISRQCKIYNKIRHNA